MMVALAAFFVALGGGAYAVNGKVTSKEIAKKAVKPKHFSKKAEDYIKGLVGQGAPGTPGTPGALGPQGPTGANGQPAQNDVAALPGAGFSATNGSVSMTPDGIEFGPYADGGANGGSVCYGGLNGQPLSSIKSLVYFARYVSDGDTGGAGAPYLRVFLANGHDAIFSPNTQPPDSDVDEGPFHTWVATSGLWRYDDDAGNGGPGTYGVNGAPFSTLIADHGNETIAEDICITTGFSSGTNLAALLRSFEINGTAFAFGG
jgi:hypothetical protein